MDAVKKKISEDPELKDLKAEMDSLSGEELDFFLKSKVAEMLTDGWKQATQKIEKRAAWMRSVFQSQKATDETTRADVLKEILAYQTKVTGKPAPEFDEEFWAALAEKKVKVKGLYRAPWGTADKVWKSEAVDRYGTRFTLGLFETKDEAKQAFSKWNTEYKKAQVQLKEEMEQWGKQENARLDKIPEIIERVKELEQEVR